MPPISYAHFPLPSEFMHYHKTSWRYNIPGIRMSCIEFPNDHIPNLNYSKFAYSRTTSCHPSRNQDVLDLELRPYPKIFSEGRRKAGWFSDHWTLLPPYLFPLGIFSLDAASLELHWRTPRKLGKGGNLKSCKWQSSLSIIHFPGRLWVPSWTSFGSDSQNAMLRSSWWLYFYVETYSWRGCN